MFKHFIALYKNKFIIIIIITIIITFITIITATVSYTWTFLNNNSDLEGNQLRKIVLTTCPSYS